MKVNEVAPFAGAWIEIKNYSEYVGRRVKSLPSRERGLKLHGGGYFD